MKNGLVFLSLMVSGCGSYSAGALDNWSIVDYCTRSAECSMEIIDNLGYYDLDDEDAYEELQVQLCVDAYYDTLQTAAFYGCRSEAKAAAVCAAKNEPIVCDYDDDELDDYEEDVQEYQTEDCWQELEREDYCW